MSSVHLVQIELTQAGLLLAILECVPLGVLQIIYSQRINSKLGTMDMLSLVTSWHDS